MAKSDSSKFSFLISEAAYEAIEQLVKERQETNPSFTNSDLVREAVEQYLATKNRPARVAVQQRGGDRRSKAARREYQQRKAG